MGRVKLLLDVVKDMRTLADSLQAVADEIVSNTAEPEPQSPQLEEIPQQKVSITQDELKEYLAVLSRQGHREKILTLFKKYGCAKLSELNPDDYDAFFDEIKEVCENAT